MAFQVPKIKSCCCGCSLRTGCNIIGWLFVFGGFSSIALSMVYGIINANFAAFSSILVEFTYTSETLFSSILLYGIHKDNYTLILPWVLYQLVNIGRNLISLSLFLILHIHGIHHELTTYMFFELVLTTYFALVVYNYYRGLKTNGPYYPEEEEEC